MEGHAQPDIDTSWIFSYEWPIPFRMLDELMIATCRGFTNWVCMPLTTMEPSVLQSEAIALSMEMQDPGLGT